MTSGSHPYLLHIARRSLNGATEITEFPDLTGTTSLESLWVVAIVKLTTSDAAWTRKAYQTRSFLSIPQCDTYSLIEGGTVSPPRPNYPEVWLVTSFPSPQTPLLLNRPEPSLERGSPLSRAPCVTSYPDLKFCECLADVIVIFVYFQFASTSYSTHSESCSSRDLSYNFIQHLPSFSGCGSIQKM